jgi:hypothetical protein
MKREALPAVCTAPGSLSTAAKKHDIKIESSETVAGERVYQIKKSTFRTRSKSKPLPARVAAFFCGLTTRRFMAN